ncbi:MAG: 23S rRNA (uracil(1939)-C(5))-methyltransferase RlmD [Castellaniella sp.]
MTLELDIESLDLEGQGVAHVDGKVVFVAGALPGERVRARIRRRKPAYDKAELQEILIESSQRVPPACAHFGVCGGCSMQHLEHSAQLAAKQRVLEDSLQHLGNVRPDFMLPPLQGPAWGYRHRARLSVRLVPRKGGVLVGFRERGRSYVADMKECLILPPAISALLLPLRTLIGGLSCPNRIPQIEVAVGASVNVLVLRHLEPMTAEDIDALRAFGLEHDISWWLQPGGPDSIHPLDRADADRLSYALPEFGLTMPFRPTDFTQVNPFINHRMVARAVQLLDPQPHERVADLFCGLGNFSLPLATRAARVVGVEGSATLVQRAAETARQHGLHERTEFRECNLFEVDEHWLTDLGPLDGLLVDPPREGALAVVKALSALSQAQRPQRLVYVSCNPATLARDAAILVHVGGYRLRGAGVMNMFPHTGHVESMAHFVHAQA